MAYSNSERFNSAMSSINAKGIEFISGQLAKDPNSRFVVAIARVNPKGIIYIGTSKSGREFVSIPVVADYADKAGQYAGLSEQVDGSGLFYTLMCSGNLGERMAKLARNGSLRSGTEFVYSGTSSIRTTAGNDGREYKNPTVNCSTLDISRWGKKENAAVNVNDRAGAAPAAAVPASKAASVQPAQPAYAAPTNADLMSVDDEDDLPF